MGNYFEKVELRQVQVFEGNKVKGVVKNESTQYPNEKLIWSSLCASPKVGASACHCKTTAIQTKGRGQTTVTPEGWQSFGSTTVKGKQSGYKVDTELRTIQSSTFESQTALQGLLDAAKIAAKKKHARAAAKKTRQEREETESANSQQYFYILEKHGVKLKKYECHPQLQHTKFTTPTTSPATVML